MNKSLWSFLFAMVATGLLSQTDTNTPPATTTTAPASASDSTSAGTAHAAKPAAAKKAASKKSATKPTPVRKKEVSNLRSVPLNPGTAIVVVSNLNVRGQAKLNSEVVAHLTKGEVVTVLEEITLKHSGPDEPSAWAKILLPSGSRVWINGTYLDANKTVVARKLNLRGGPGENYSVLGLLMRGESVTQVKAKDDWVQIEAPTNAYAFVAAQYLTQQMPEQTPTPAPPVVTPPVAAAPTVTPAPEPTAPPVTTPVAAVVTPPPVVAEPPPTVTPVPSATPPPVAAAAPTESAPPVVEPPPPPRIVQREGLVRGTLSIQAPTKFELVSAENGRTINYLYTSSPDLDLRRWKGLHIVVTGEEGLDERWQNTPVITIQKIELLDEK